MIANYAYVAGAALTDIAGDLLRIICDGSVSGLSGAANVGACSVSGDAHPGGYIQAGNSFYRAAVRGGFVGYDFLASPYVGAAWAGLCVGPSELDSGGNNVGYPSVLSLAFGQNSAALTMAAAGVVRIALNAEAVLISFPYAGSRQVCLLGEASGDYFGTEYPRGFVISTQAVAGGGAGDALAKVPYFKRVKNHAAAGDKVGLNGVALAIAAHPASATGSVIGANELVQWQGLPVELWSNAKAAHFGYARGVLLAPQKGIANDEYLTIAGENYIVFRENATAAVAFAIKA